MIIWDILETVFPYHPYWCYISSREKPPNLERRRRWEWRRNDASFGSLTDSTPLFIWITALYLKKWLGSTNTKKQISCRIFVRCCNNWIWKLRSYGKVEWWWWWRKKKERIIGGLVMDGFDSIWKSWRPDYFSCFGGFINSCYETDSQWFQQSRGGLNKKIMHPADMLRYTERTGEDSGTVS